MFDYSVFDSKENYKVGLKQSVFELKRNNVKIMFIAKDADAFVLREPIKIAAKNSVQVIEVKSKKYLGELCKIDISAAIAVVIINKQK